MSGTTEVSMTNGPLERFLLLAKGASGRAVSLTIDQVLSSPDVHVFAELLDLPNVQKLRGTGQEPSLALLELFAYGSYPEYKAAVASLPKLNPQQLKKLRLLTIVSLGSSRKTLPYAELMQALDVTTLRELEDLIIDAIYRKLVFGKLDQKNRQFTIDKVIGRDLKEGDLEKMTQLFVNWAENCGNIIGEMDREMSAADKSKADDTSVEADILKQIDDAKSVLKVAAASDTEHPHRKKFNTDGPHIGRGAPGLGSGGRGKRY